MSIKSRKGIFPWFTIVEGIFGFILQCWLFSDKDANGLLPPYHIAGILSFGLLALTFVVCLLGARQEKDLCPDKLFFSSAAASGGLTVSAIGLAFSAFTLPGTGILGVLTLVSGILAAAALGYIAYCRAKGSHADAMLHCVITLYLILRTMSSCSSWSSEPQFQKYFFPLIACMFLMISSYYRAALALKMEHSKNYVFFSQMALFCCCMCCRGSDWLFYLTCALWLTFDCPAPSSVPKGHFLKDD